MIKFFKNIKATALSALIFFSSLVVSAQQKAPAYPLITHDPYFSIWSFTDTLNSATTTHWTGAEHSLTGLLKVDGKVYRFLGREDKPLNNVLPTSDEEDYTLRYTETAPSEDWTTETFNETAWKTGAAPFGDGTSAKTSWTSKDLWVRRTFSLKDVNLNKLFLKINHDDNTEVYLNGDKIYNKQGWLNKFQNFPIDDNVKSKLKMEGNVLAIHVANTSGGQWLDAGIVEELEPKKKEVIEEAVQKNVTLNATQTIYDFTCGMVNLTVTFTSSLLMNNLDLLSRPVSYISYKVKSADAKTHSVQLFFGASTDIAVNTPAQQVTAQKSALKNLSYLKAGTTAQPV